MRLLQQVMCQRHIHVPTAHTCCTESPCFEPDASRDAGSGAIRLSFRWPYLDATGQTMSDRSESHFISTTAFDYRPAPQSTVAGREHSWRT
jgi:hypothetical protein